ncbi:DUF308 domain-containing protein [Bradyrhizobium sp.]|uniref:DUF308 domain-containing protein n=1 Tax=Bradyrhizobium sp. TaxID=376 RepID=UPI001D9A8327|nr:DUF308 domain-containing protein [Bradyrhizobium sp.]MBI5318892.1 DUF308 domain-containing protein [Bradyrhizobium sp.]
MLMVLLGAGIGLLLVGLGALGYGIQYKEFGLGNTLIVAGAVSACSGFLMAGLWAVARELQHISQRLGSGAVASAQPAFPAFPAEPSLAPALAPSPPLPRAAAEAAPADDGAAPPWVEGRSDAEPPPPAEAAPAPKPRRNLLFTSTSRKERERAAARASEPLAPDLLSADLRPNPPAVDAPPVEPAAPQPPSFEDAWPKSERMRRSGRGPAPDAASPAPAPQVTVLKSGVVDGMAYSLYSDGSIEAQMPEGMMRFASIDELRAHLDQRP